MKLTNNSPKFQISPYYWIIS